MGPEAVLVQEVGQSLPAPGEVRGALEVTQRAPVFWSVGKALPRGVTRLATYTVVKPFRCLLCHKMFSQKAPLQDHLNLYTGTTLLSVTTVLYTLHSSQASGAI